MHSPESGQLDKKLIFLFVFIFFKIKLAATFATMKWSLVYLSFLQWRHLPAFTMEFCDNSTLTREITRELTTRELLRDGRRQKQKFIRPKRNFLRH
jgi:hypothetical protein